MGDASHTNACMYFYAGHCLYDEVTNPGYAPGNRCRRLAELVDSWEDFVSRADSFGLSEHDAAHIWEKRRHPALKPHSGCAAPLVVEAGGKGVQQDIMSCPHLLGTACTLSFPACEARCRRFRERVEPEGLL